MNRRFSPAANQKLREASRNISGVNETVASGLSLALARPHLLVVPVLLDVLLWIGLQVPITRLTSPLADLMEDQGGENGDLAAEQLVAIGQSARLNDLIGAMVPSVFAGLSRENLFHWMTSVFLPEVARGVDRDRLPEVWSGVSGALADPGGLGSLLGLALLFLLVASLLSVGWRVPLALAIARRPLTPRQVAAYVARCWVRVLGLIGLIVVVGIVGVVPLLVVAGILLLLGLNFAALISLLLIVAVSIAAIYARFVLESIIVDDIGPLRAVRRSALVTQTFFGPTLRFTLAALLLATGALRLWDTMIDTAPGLPIAIVVNAFVGTGLAVASMMFYSDRSLLLHRFTPARPSSDGQPPL